MAGPHSRVPFVCGDTMAARLEDPQFAEVLGRARAKARHEEYDPARHHPWRGVGRGRWAVDPEAQANLSEIIARFAAKGGKWKPEVPPEREKAVEQARHLRLI